MTELVSERWVWDESTFVQAWELGAFGERRVELVEGEVWLVSIGDWHDEVTANVTRALPNGGEWRVTQSSLPSAGSVPDPDVWVRRADARPVERVGSRLSRWVADDVVLVVEVSDATVGDDTTTKARVYGRARFGCYWVVHRGGVEVFTEPHDLGYRVRRSFLAGDAVPVPYGASAKTLAVSELLAADEGAYE